MEGSLSVSVLSVRQSLTASHSSVDLPPSHASSPG